MANGARAVLCEANREPHEGNYWLLLVKSVSEALLKLARTRRKMTAATIIAVSGSTGKTTLKDLIACLLSQRGRVQKSGGNFNSTIGLPLSLLQMEEADFFVLEVGINHVGEMESLSNVLAPDLAILTNVGTAHIGHFSSADVLLEEKCKLAAGQPTNGILLLGEGISRRYCRDLSQSVFTAGWSEDASFRLQNQRHGRNGITADVTDGIRTVCGLSWPIPGSIGASVLSLGGAVGMLFGFSDDELRSGIADAARSAARMNIFEIGHISLIDDSYNASPEAMIASLEALSYLGADYTAALLGDMGELGEQAHCLHELVGESAARSGVRELFLYGDFCGILALGALRGGMDSSHVHVYSFGQEQLLAQDIINFLPRGSTLLCKASRKTALERVIRYLWRKE